MLKENGKSRCSSILKENGKSRCSSILKENGKSRCSAIFRGERVEYVHTAISSEYIYILYTNQAFASNLCFSLLTFFFRY